MDENNKYKLCRYHSQGKCKFGNTCKFSHQMISCYLMRHAQSVFNQFIQNSAVDANSIQAKTKFQMSTDLIDCGLSGAGVKQINQFQLPDKIRANRKTVEFDIIFVSPLERCLKTAHKIITKRVVQSKKIIVLPGLTQVLSKICDFSTQLSLKIQKYENFDFTYLKNYLDKEQKQWQDSLVDPQFQPLIDREQIFATRYMKILDQIFPQPLESSKRCFDRVMETLEEMKKICIELKSKKVLVVSHNRIIKYIMGRDNHGKSQSVKNCQVKFTHF